MDGAGGGIVDTAGGWVTCTSGGVTVGVFAGCMAGSTFFFPNMPNRVISTLDLTRFLIARQDGIEFFLGGMPADVHIGVFPSKMGQVCREG